MNKQQLVKSIGFRVRLVPPPITRQGAPANEDWIVRDVQDDRVQLERTVAGHVKTLGIDQVYSFSTDPELGVQHGFLSLHGQIIIDGMKVDFEPSLPPRAQALPDPARLALMDGRLEMARAEYRQSGTPRRVIDSFTDLSTDEKADLYDRTIKCEKGRLPKGNPYRPGTAPTSSTEKPKERSRTYKGVLGPLPRPDTPPSDDYV